MSPPVRRPLVAIDDPLNLGERRPAAEPVRQRAEEPSAEPEPHVSRPVLRSERRALFVRLSVGEADAVARAAFELGVAKQELIGALVRRYVDARSPEGLAALREMLRRA